MHRIFLIGFVLLLSLAGCARNQVIVPQTGALTSWTLTGGGSVEALSPGEGYRLIEGNGSKGITLISPAPFGDDVVLRFKAKPEKREGVCVALLSISDSTGTLRIPADHDGAMNFWTQGSIRNYMIAFHTAFHQPNMYISRNPGLVQLTQTPDPAGDEAWYEMEIGKKGSRIWVRVNGAKVLECTDPQGGLPGGYVGIRLRGPGDGSFSCLLKDVTAQSE